MQVIYRPFAIRLPAGQGEFVTFGHRRGINKAREELRSTTVSYKDQKGQWQTRRESRWVTVYDRVTVGDASPVPAATFEVAPGKVRYVGRVGMLVHVTSPSGPQRQDCANGQLEQFSSKHKQELCVARELFVGSAPDADLAIIRRRFPNLAGTEIEVQPLHFGSGGWPGFSQAAGRLGTGL